VNEEERAVIEHRLARAHEAIEEAQGMFKEGHLNTYVSRLYYACFYAVSALLSAHGWSTSKHSQLRALLHRELVKTGILSLEMGRHFDRLFRNRQKADYGDFVEFKADEVAGWLDETRTFVSAVEEAVRRDQGAS